MSSSVLARNGSTTANKPLAASESGKFSALAQRTQQARAMAAAAASGGIMKPPVSSRLSSELSTSHQLKPKLIRQAAILADADSTGSGKSVTFRDHQQHQQCPVHSADYLAALNGRYRTLYNKLIESNQEDEESDMEASDPEDEAEAAATSDHLPLGTTFRSVAAAAQQPLLLQTQPRLAASNTASRKLSTISSKDSNREDEDEDGNNFEAAAAASEVKETTTAVIERTRSYGDNDVEAAEALLKDSGELPKDEGDGAKQTITATSEVDEEAAEVTIGQPRALSTALRTAAAKKRYLNTDV